MRRKEANRERMGPKVCWTPVERVVLQTQRRRADTVTRDCDRRHHDGCECAENGGRASRSLSHLGKHRNCELYTGAKEEPRDHVNTTLH